MGGEVIKSFLVGLGFDVDESSLSKFNKSIQSAALRVTTLYASIQTAAAGIFYAISGISKGFEDMGYELRLVQPAMNRWLVLRQAMLEAYSKAGVNLTKVVQQSILFNYSLAKTKFALEAAYKGVAAKFFPILTKQMDIFRLKIYANMPKIQSALQKFVEFIFKAFEITVQFGERLWSILTRVWDFFVKLDKATNGWSTAILGFIAAWKLLNLAFIATPFGALLAGLAALLVLYDDFETFKEGGKSLFNWAPFIPVINAISDTIKSLTEYLGDLFTIVFDIVGLFKDLFTLNFSSFGEDLKNTFSDIGKTVNDLVSSWLSFLNVGGSLLAFGSSVYGWTKDHLGGGTVNPSLATQPLLPNQSGVNQNVNQQTNINVNGAADASSVGKTVVGSQNRVNSDMTRNMKQAVQ